MKWIAHRGLHMDAVENTLNAFKIAVEANYDGIECDIRLTSDDRFIVYHDETFLRLNGIHVKTQSLTLLEATKMTYLEDPHAHILALETLLKWMQQKRKTMLIEIKDILNQSQAQHLSHLLNQYDIDYVIISFHLQNIIFMKPFQTMWLVSKVTKNILFEANQSKIDHLGCNVKHMTPKILHMCFNHQIQVSLWTVNSKQDIWSTFPLQYITTDLKQ